MGVGCRSVNHFFWNIISISVVNNICKCACEVYTSEHLNEGHFGDIHLGLRSFE
jgi:hypothetical protein